MTWIKDFTKLVDLIFEIHDRISIKALVTKIDNLLEPILKTNSFKNDLSSLYEGRILSSDRFCFYAACFLNQDNDSVPASELFAIFCKINMNNSDAYLIDQVKTKLTND